MTVHGNPRKSIEIHGCFFVSNLSNPVNGVKHPNDIDSWFIFELKVVFCYMHFVPGVLGQGLKSYAFISVYKMSDGREVSPDFLNGPLCDVQPEAIHCFCFSCFMVKLHLTFHSLMQFNHFNELPSCLPQIPRPKDPQKEALAIYKRYEDELLSEAWYQDGKAFRISSPKEIGRAHV